MKVTTTTELHLVFSDSNHRQYVEKFRDYQPNLSPAMLKSVMEDMVLLDCPDEKGIRHHAQVVCAKYVAVITSVIFDYSKDLAKNNATMSTVTPIKKPTPARKPRPKKTSVSLSDMARMSATTITKITSRDFVVNGVTPTTAERYLSTAIKSQVLNNILPKNKQIDPYIFSPVMKKLYAMKTWAPVMVFYLEEVKNFFTPPAWLEVAKHYQTVGREITAGFFGDGQFANYQKADEFITKIVTEAKENSDNYYHRKSALAEKMKSLVG